MIQSVAKLRFVERYCHPGDGWQVFVDSDPSEEGRTGSPRQTDEARARQTRMIEESAVALTELRALGTHVGQRKVNWRSCFGRERVLPVGDRDIIALHEDRRILWVTEVEGDSGGQPEGKIYKAVGQLVCAATEFVLPEFDRSLTVAVWGEKAAAHLHRTRAVGALGVGGLLLGLSRDEDRWLFGGPPARS